MENEIQPIHIAAAMAIKQSLNKVSPVRSSVLPQEVLPSVRDLSVSEQVHIVHDYSTACLQNNAVCGT